MYYFLYNLAFSQLPIVKGWTSRTLGGGYAFFSATNFFFCIFLKANFFFHDTTETNNFFNAKPEANFFFSFIVIKPVNP